MWWLEKIPRCREKKLKLTKITGSDQSIIVLILSNFVITSHQTKHCWPQETCGWRLLAVLALLLFNEGFSDEESRIFKNFSLRERKGKKNQLNVIARENSTTPFWHCVTFAIDQSGKYHNSLADLGDTSRKLACRADVILASECFDFNGSGSGERNKSVY